MFACIWAKSLGTANKPLLLVGGIANVSRLALCGAEIHVNIPSYLSWREFRCHAYTELDIRHAFANS